jgi:hypothetical protein
MAGPQLLLPTLEQEYMDYFSERRHGRGDRWNYNDRVQHMIWLQAPLPKTGQYLEMDPQAYFLNIRDKQEGWNDHIRHGAPWARQFDPYNPAHIGIGARLQLAEPGGRHDWTKQESAVRAVRDLDAQINVAQLKFVNILAAGGCGVAATYEIANDNGETTLVVVKGGLRDNPNSLQKERRNNDVSYSFFSRPTFDVAPDSSCSHSLLSHICVCPRSSRIKTPSSSLGFVRPKWTLCTAHSY